MQEERFQELIEKGLHHSKAGQANEAIDCFRAAGEIKAELPVNVLSALGRQYIKVEHYDKAAEVFEKTIARFPSLPAGYIGVARVWARKQQWQSAADQWRLTLEKFPEKVQAFWYIDQAQAFMQLGRYEEAKANYARCIEAFPDTVQAYAGMAEAAQHSGQWEEALRYWETCWSRFPAERDQKWHNGKKRALIELKNFAELNELELARFESSPGQAYINHIREKLKHQKPHNLHFRHLFIITYGRSGSTLLQGILNTIDGVVVRGENGNVFYDLFRAYTDFSARREQHLLSVLPNQPWFGIGLVNNERLLEQYRELAKTILATEIYENADQLCFGFKEIRYEHYHIKDDLHPYLAFLKQLFPDPAFIFLTRNLEEVSKSAWWKDKDQDIVKEKLGRLEQQFSGYAAQHDNCYEITYQDIISTGGKLKGLFTFLGAPFDTEIIESALNFPHSYAPSQKHVQQLFKNKKAIKNIQGNQKPRKGWRAKLSAALPHNIMEETSQNTQVGLSALLSWLRSKLSK